MFVPARRGRTISICSLDVRNERQSDRPRRERADMKKPQTKRGSPPRSWEDDDGFLSPAEMRKIERLAQNARDPVRYMLVSEFGPRFSLYYNVSDDVFAMNNPSGGTLFKRRQAAEQIKKLLGRRIRIVKCTSKNGRLKWLSPHTIHPITKQRSGKST